MTDLPGVIGSSQRGSGSRRKPMICFSLKADWAPDPRAAEGWDVGRCRLTTIAVRSTLADIPPVPDGVRRWQTVPFR